jgi:hypothetical protein
MIQHRANVHEMLVPQTWLKQSVIRQLEELKLKRQAMVQCDAKCAWKRATLQANLTCNQEARAVFKV